MVDALVHAQGGKGLGACGQRLDGMIDIVGVDLIVAGSRDRFGLLDQRFDGRTFGVVQQITIGLQRGTRGQQHAFGLDTRLAQRPRGHVVFGVRETVLQHLRNLLVGQPVAGLDHHRSLDT